LDEFYEFHKRLDDYFYLPSVFHILPQKNHFHPSTHKIQ